MSGRKITNQVSISLDTDDQNSPIPVLLITPNPASTDNHYHIELDPKSATQLYDFLAKYLGINA